MKVLQLGLGRRGRNILRNLSRLYLEGLIEEIFIYDPIEELVRNALKLYRIAKPGDPDKDYDAVFIVTPPGTHYQLAKKYLERGIAAFIEKPPVLSVDQLEELVKLGKASADMLLRYSPVVEFLKSQKPIFVEAARATIPSRSVDVSVIRDVMIHDLDLLYFVYGYQRPIYAKKLYDLQGYPSPSAAEARLEKASIKALRTTKNVRLRERRLYFEDRLVIVNTSTNTVEVFGEERKIKTLSGEEPLYLSIRDFILYVSENKRPKNELSTLRNTIRACSEIEELTRA